MKYLKQLFFLTLFLFSNLFSAVKKDYLDFIKNAVENSWRNYPALIEQWKGTAKHYVLWGYNPPGEPIYLADALGFLYKLTGDKNYALRAIKILQDYSELKNFYPKEFAESRVEYSEGVPTLPNFFFLFPYVRAYLNIKNSGLINEELKRKLIADISGSIDHISYFPEWGAHNRTVLRALAYLLGSIAFPDHPSASIWRNQANVLVYDNLGKWEAEDATLYNGVWLHTLLIYIENSGDENILKEHTFRYYFEYYLNLITPFGTIADIGDANFNNAFERFIPCFEKAASFYKDGRYKYAAEKIFKRMLYDNKMSADLASIISDAYRWCDDKIKIVTPTEKSREVLEDIIGKKIVFRTGWDSLSTYLLLNYRDEGDGNYLTRHYLRTTIPVEEEKMHHGSSDENAITFLMTRGSILLHHAGYRDALPSGMYGAFRADYFHNRLVVRKNKREARSSPIYLTPTAKNLKKQSLLEFIRNSGNYRESKTYKIDFLTFNEVEYSRTRLTDEKIGYFWDRIIVFLKKFNWFVVVDAVKFTQTDYYTLAVIWHTQRILQKGNGFYDTRIDSIGRYKVGGDYNLLIYFPESYAKEDSFEQEFRHFQDEFAIYQTISSHYKTNDVEFFITFLIPHHKDEKIDSLIRKIKLLNVDKFPQGIGLGVENGDEKVYLCLKLDLDFEILRENVRPRYNFESGKIKYDKIETDAYFAYLNENNKESSLYYAVSNFIGLNFDGKTLAKAKPYTFGLQLDGGPDRVGYTKLRFFEDKINLVSKND
jgi:hypothetical protein